MQCHLVANPRVIFLYFFRREGSQPVVDSNSMLIAVHIVLEIHAIAANAPEDNAVLVFLPGIFLYLFSMSLYIPN